MKAILTHYHIPIGMEMFSADDDEQWTTIKETIDASDYYVLIIGHRYGTLSSEGNSYTEKEFKYALEQKIPTYVFIRDRNVATTPDQRDNDPHKAQLLDAFIESAKTGRMTDFWKNKDDLALKVMSALNKAFARTQRVDWVRADQVIDSTPILEQMAELSRKYIEVVEDNEKLKVSAASALRAPQFAFEFNEGKPFVVELNDSKLPSNLFIEGDDNYNQGVIQFIHRYNYQVLVFNISNTGTRTATEVYIDFDFPKGVEIRQPQEAQPSPPMPEKGLSQENMTRWAKTSSYIRRATQTKSIEQPTRINTQAVYDVNRLTFYLAELPHKRTFYFCESFLSCPEPISEAMLKIRITCDEQGESQIFEYPISAVKIMPGYHTGPNRTSFKK